MAGRHHAGDFRPMAGPDLITSYFCKFTGKKLAVLGFGFEGKQLCRFLSPFTKNITVFDQKKPADLDPDWRAYHRRGVEFICGPDYLGKGLTGFDYIFRSPGFHRLAPALVRAEKKGSLISSATKIFFDLCPGHIIAVTGTKGKGTTSTLINLMFKKAGRSTYLAGNVGLPMLPLLKRLKPEDYVVLELSSFQLQDLHKSPEISVVLFITSEHLDVHRSTNEYIKAKSQLVRHQSRKDITVLNADNPVSSSFAAFTKAKVHYFSRRRQTNAAYVLKGNIYFKDKIIGPVSNLQLRGEHNWDNVCAAISAALLSGVPLSVVKQTAFTFKGLEHRLEYVRSVNGVAYYNDSFSTNPESTIAAVNSFKEPLLLIAGGSDKQADYTRLGRVIAASTVKTLILIGQTADRIKKSTLKGGYQGSLIWKPPNMSEIVACARQAAAPGDVVLLSPASASFDMFADYHQRGELFKKYVNQI